LEDEFPFGARPPCRCYVSFGESRGKDENQQSPGSWMKGSWQKGDGAVARMSKNMSHSFNHVFTCGPWWEILNFFGG